jgi:hypothetical protein
MSARAWSARSAALLAGSTLRECARQRVPVGVTAVAASLVGGGWLLREFDFGASELKFLLDLGFGVQGLFGAILAIVVTAQQFFAAVDRRWAPLVLARPVRRGEFIAGQLGGALLLLLGFCALLTVLLAALLWWRETGLMREQPEAFLHGRRVPYTGLVWAGLAQWLRLAVLAAITLCVASYARSGLFATLAGFGALMACQLQHLAREHFAALAPAWARGGAWLLGALVPDLHRFDLADELSGGGTLAAGQFAGLAAYALVWLAVLGLLGAYSFRQRDL